MEVRASGRRKAPAAEKDSALANLAAERERRSGKGSGKGDKPTQGDGPSQKARGSNGRQGKGDRSDEDAEMGERGRGKGKRGSGKGADSGDDDASDGDDGEVRVSGMVRLATLAMIHHTSRNEIRNFCSFKTDGDQTGP